MYWGTTAKQSLLHATVSAAGRSYYVVVATVYSDIQYARIRIPRGQRHAICSKFNPPPRNKSRYCSIVVLRIAVLRIAYCVLRIAYCVLRIAYCVLRISSIDNPPTIIITYYNNPPISNPPTMIIYTIRIILSLELPRVLDLRIIYLITVGI
jgi:hypothetical protein